MYVMWDMHSRTTPEQARINRECRTDASLEADPTIHDADDDSYVVARSGMVYDPARPDQRPGWSS